MSLVIVVGGLEPTKDGIGDHSRRVAGALIKRGLPTSILALSDTRVADGPCRERQDDEGVGIETLRVSNRLTFTDRVGHGRRFIDEMGGRHALFAFAPYQFDIRGVVSRALVELPDMVRGLSCSFLFHETWIGEQENSGLWTRLVGFTQRRLIQMLVHDLKPAKVYTTNGLYRRMLEAYDITTSLLPHCGNVPVQESRADWLPDALAQHGVELGGVELGSRGLSDVYMIGLFGSLYDNLELPRLLPIFDTVARRKGKRPLIANIGIMGDRPEWRHWQRVYGKQYGLVDLGPETTLRISQFINSLDLGVSTTSLPQVGKSGTAAAFLEHGIPVLVPTEQPYFRHWRESMMSEFPANCFRLTPDISARLYAAERMPPKPRLPALADKLYAELKPYVS
jgi:hypothetical protein